MSSLYLEHLLVRTPLEKPALHMRSLCGAMKRRRFPELHEIYAEQDRIERALRQTIRRDWNCIDVGCHIGSHLSLIVRFAPQGRHIAFEPIMQKALWLERKFPDVDVRSIALADQGGQRTFYRNLTRSGLSGFASYFEPGDEIAEVAVDCARLDDFTGPDRRYSYVKIDVEGAELLVLRGARQTIDRDRPVILFESSHNGAPRLGLSREGLFACFIDELQYSVFLVRDFLERRSPLNLAGFHKAAEYPFQAFNFLAIPREGIRQSD